MFVEQARALRLELAADYLSPWLPGLPHSSRSCWIPKQQGDDGRPVKNLPLLLHYRLKRLLEAMRSDAAVAVNRKLVGAGRLLVRGMLKWSWSTGTVFAFRDLYMIFFTAYASQRQRQAVSTGADRQAGCLVAERGAWRLCTDGIGGDWISLDRFPDRLCPFTARKGFGTASSFCRRGVSNLFAKASWK